MQIYSRTDVPSTQRWLDPSLATMNGSVCPPRAAGAARCCVRTMPTVCPHRMVHVPARLGTFNPIWGCTQHPHESRISAEAIGKCCLPLTCWGFQTLEYCWHWFCDGIRQRVDTSKEARSERTSAESAGGLSQQPTYLCRCELASHQGGLRPRIFANVV